MFSAKNPVGVLIHGCHLQADLGGRSWQKLVWGSDSDEPTMAGRVVMGVYVALLRQARVVTFSTGASEKDGLKEAEYTLRFVMERCDQLAALLSKALNKEFTGNDLRSWLEHRYVLDIESQNTVEETVANLGVALKRNCKEVIGVTNAFHAPRCLAGLQAARIKHKSPLIVSVVPAYDEDYGTVIIEPPHRGDQPKTNWYQIVRGIFRIPEAKRQLAEQELSDLIARHTR